MAPGENEVFDTLDQAPAWAMTSVVTLHDFLVAPIKSNGVGVVFAGQGDLCRMGSSRGYWGKSLRLETGEQLQIRTSPRQTMGEPLKTGHPRMMTFRRTSVSMATVVGVVILYVPHSSGDELNGAGNLCSARTIGCRGVQVILPSLFNKHDAKRELPNQLINIDSCGYHSIRPSTYTIAKIRKDDTQQRGGELVVSVSPGDAYLVIACHMCGVNIADPLRRALIPIGHKDHLHHISALQAQMIKAVGENERTKHISASLTLLDLIGAEGVVGMLCNSLFNEALPDMLHSPMGLPFVIVMASRIACFPGMFGLPSSTTNDIHANHEISASFNNRWMRVTKSECRAIDCAIKAGYDHALMRIKHDGKGEEGEKSLKVYMDENIGFWQRVGQRINTQLVSETRASPRRIGKGAMETRFGRADLVDDTISDAKYAHWEKVNVGAPVSELPVERIHLASRSDMRTQFNSMQDRTEVWLRDGLYGTHRLSRENASVGTVVTKKNEDKRACKWKTMRDGGGNCDCVLSENDDQSSSDSDSDSTDSDDVDFLQEYELNFEAMKSATETVAISLVHGASVFHQFGIEAFLVGKEGDQKCADCDDRVGVVQSVMLGSRATQCRFCNHRRCFRCATTALKRMNPMERCGACLSAGEIRSGM